MQRLGVHVGSKPFSTCLHVCTIFHVHVVYCNILPPDVDSEEAVEFLEKMKDKVCFVTFIISTGAGNCTVITSVSGLHVIGLEVPYLVCVQLMYNI